MKEERNYGIDLLRIIAMLLVVVLHCLGQGGLLKSVIVGTAKYNLIWALEIFAYCAVDLFALISGYVGWNHKTNYKKYLCLWLQVVFYCNLIVIGFQIFMPSVVSKTDYLKSFFPVAKSLYWYFTAYTALYMIKPLLDKAINACDKTTLKKIFVVIITVFSVYDILFNMFFLNGGYTAIWLIILYVLGAIISKCEIAKDIKTHWLIIMGIVLYAVMYIYFVYGEVITNALKPPISPGRDFLVNYTSPTVLGMAVIVILCISRMKFKPRSQKTISFLATSAFTIYLFNNHYLIWKYIMKDLFVCIANLSIVKIYAIVIGFTLLFSITAIMIDKIRILIFKTLKIDKLAETIANILNKIVTSIANVI